MNITETNQRIAEQLNEAFNRGDLDAAANCCTEDCQNHGRRVGRAVLGEIKLRHPQLMRCRRGAFRLFDQYLISKSVCPNGEVSIGAWTNHLRKDFLTTHGLELLAEVGNRIHFQHWNGGPDGIVRLLLQDVDQHLSIFANDTFKDTYKMEANGESLHLTHIPPAHTDTDIIVRFQESNVLHAGDLFFNGMYPYIDGGTGGSIGGMIASSDKLLTLADKNTKIIPGHGPLGNAADLAKFRDMLSTTRDRVLKLKTAGKSVQEAVAAKPFADIESAWGKGFFNGDVFVQIVYVTL